MQPTLKLEQEIRGGTVQFPYLNLDLSSVLETELISSLLEDNIRVRAHLDLQGWWEEGV